MKRCFVRINVNFTLFKWQVPSTYEKTTYTSPRKILESLSEFDVFFVSDKIIKFWAKSLKLMCKNCFIQLDTLKSNEIHWKIYHFCGIIVIFSNILQTGRIFSLLLKNKHLFFFLTLFASLLNIEEIWKIEKSAWLFIFKVKK